MTDQTQQAATIGNYQIKRGAGFDSEAFMSVEHMPSGCGQDFFERTDMFMFKFLESLATAPAVGAPVATSGVLPLPVGIPTYDRFGKQTKAHFTADQMHEYAARCMLHAIPAQPAASLREQEAVVLPVNETEAMHDAVMAILYHGGITRTRTNELWKAYRSVLLDAQRLGREKEKP